MAKINPWKKPPVDVFVNPLITDAHLKLKEYRLKAGYTPGELAPILKVSMKHYTALEKGGYANYLPYRLFTLGPLLGFDPYPLFKPELSKEEVDAYRTYVLTKLK
jgi:DNA-binding XRE family transcriptional regulator